MQHGNVISAVPANNGWAQSVFCCVSRFCCIRKVSVNAPNALCSWQWAVSRCSTCARCGCRVHSVDTGNACMGLCEAAQAWYLVTNRCCNQFIRQCQAETTQHVQGRVKKNPNKQLWNSQLGRVPIVRCKDWVPCVRHGADLAQALPMRIRLRH